MNSYRNVLETGITDSRAVLPAPPTHWSYSSLREMAECPRRYALAQADYPDLWDRVGYPTLPSTAALFGNVVHGAVETVVKAFVKAGVQSLDSVKATEVLREIGGLTTVVELLTTTQLARLDAIPRLDAHRRRRIARELRAESPEARGQVQTFLSRTAFVPRAVTTSGRPSSMGARGTRHALGEGTHAEVRLVDDELRVGGRVDLLTIHDGDVEIVDYKTGAESAGHLDQMRLYALLWHRDRVVNPASLAITSLTLTYRDHDVRVGIPSAVDLDALVETLVDDVEHADAELISGEPTPIPSENNCRFCGVRQLCAAYWQSIAPEPREVKEGVWFDYEGVIGEQNGQHSWWAAQPDSGRPDLLLRTSATTSPFAEGDRVRLLGIVRDTDLEAGIPVGTLVGSSEVFRVES